MFCGSKPRDPNKEISREIDDMLEKEKKKLNSVIQLLLLGTGESGKTTIIKQMKILHINGFSEKEKLEKVSNIKQNIHESIYTLVKSLDKISPPLLLENERSKEYASFIIGIGLEEPTDYTDEYFDKVKILWNDPIIQRAYMRSNEFQLIDSAKHFLNRLDDIRKTDYVPTIQDILFCRVMTIAISKIEFRIPYKRNFVDFRMYDVGGQRGHRQKWISVFEGIHAILFVIAASDFDQTLREDETKNRLEESFIVFKDIFWSKFVRTSGKIVFLNKQDILKFKIENGQKIEKYFPEYENYVVKDKNADNNSEYERAKYFIRDKVINLAEKLPNSERMDILPGVSKVVNVRPQRLFIHFTIATDTKNVKLVFDDVKDTILLNNLNELDLL